jgi:hypothetical protein
MLWGLDVDVFSPDLRAVDLWVTLPARLSHPQLTEVASWGFQDEPEGLYAQARLLVDAHDEAAARELGERLLGELLAGTEARVRALAVAPAPADEPIAPGPEEFESRLVATPWHRHEPIGDGRGL